MAEGRRIHANIRTFLRYGLAGGLAEVVVLLCRAVARAADPAHAGDDPLGQHGHARPSGRRLRRRAARCQSHASTVAVAVAIGARPHPDDPDRVRRALVAATSLAAGWWAFDRDTDFQTAVFLTLGLGQLSVALALRAPRSRPVWRLRWNERGLELAVLAAAVCQVAGAVVPGLHVLLGTEPVSAQELLVLVAAGAVPGLVVAASRARWLTGRNTSERGSLAPVDSGQSEV